jgi:hypothetical protein
VNIANKMYIGGIEKKPLMVPLMWIEIPTVLGKNHWWFHINDFQ